MNPIFPSLSSQQAPSVNRFIDEMNQRRMIWTRSKTKDLIYTCTKPPHKKTIVKLTMDKQGQVLLWLRFSATQNYSAFFNSKLIETLEEDGNKYSGCYPGCHECIRPVGYSIQTERGLLFRCYKELIKVGPIEEVPLEEAFALIEAQDIYESSLKQSKVRD